MFVRFLLIAGSFVLGALVVALKEHIQYTRRTCGQTETPYPRKDVKST